MTSHSAVQRAGTLPLGLDDLTDEGLARVARQYVRMIEDAEDDAKQYPWRTDQAARTVREARVHASRVRELQKSRFRLRMRYGAVDNHVGADQPQRVYAHGEPMTYRLAAAIDLYRCRAGLSHVLAWAAPRWPSGVPARAVCPTAVELRPV